MRDSVWCCGRIPTLRRRPSGGAVMNTVLEVASPDCVADDFDGEVVVLNVVSGVYFSLRDLAAAVWRDLAAGHSVGSLISGIGRTDELLAAATARLIDKFEQSGPMRSASARRVETVQPQRV